MISDQAEIDLRGIFEYIAFELQAPENTIKQIYKNKIIWKYQSEMVGAFFMPGEIWAFFMPIFTEGGIDRG